mmetsp:Transcript_88084/g.284479  ORF Transcript_88084/g.284479 Transcript_88084/m.284479 type:complete len:639 (+) Transcript_88084:142-2058(+)
MPTTCGTVSIGSWPSNAIEEDSAAEICFGFKFDIAPSVSVQLSGIDAASPNSKCVELWTSDVTCTGFRLHARTWGDAATYSIKASWVATSELASVQLGSLSFAGGAIGTCDPEVESVTFPRPFACAPDVAFGISAVDAQGSEPFCTYVELLSTNARGFTFRRRRATESTQIRSVTLSWIASACPASLQTGSLDVGSRGAPIAGAAEHVAEVRFPRAFDRVPEVALAFAALDVDVATHTRAQVCAERVTREGFRLRVRSWEDSTIWQSRISWVATPVKSAATSSSILPHLPPGKFAVEGPALGKGWCAVTHKAKNITDGRVYAVKTSRYPFKQHEQALLQELQNLMRLPLHVNLLRYNGCILEGGRLHIVMECMDAFRLADLVSNPELGPGRSRASITVLRWLYQLLDGLAHLHHVGLVHRDLHGENILVEKALDGSPSDGPRAIRIIDFGAAGSYSEPAKPRLMSQQAGCPQYFSPERRRAEPFDDRDDVWAAGCHLVELASAGAIRCRQDCGKDGADFSSTSSAVRQAIRDCDRSADKGSRCRELAQALLVESLDRRPRAAQARDLARRLLGYVPGKRLSGPSGGPRGTCAVADCTVDVAAAASPRPSKICCCSPRATRGGTSLRRSSSNMAQSRHR